MEVYNNLKINLGNGLQAYFSACNTARDANGVPTSPHYMGTITLAASNAASDDCTDGTEWTSANNPNLARQGVDAFQLSGRLYSSRAFPTSSVPNTPSGNQANNSPSVVAQQSLAIGAAGVAVAAAALLVIAFLLWRTSALAARVDELSKGRQPAVHDWGTPKSAPAVGTPNPVAAAGQITQVTTVN